MFFTILICFKLFCTFHCSPFRLIFETITNVPDKNRIGRENISKCSGTYREVFFLFHFRLFETTLNVPKFCSILHYKLFRTFPNVSKRKIKEVQTFQNEAKNIWVSMFENISRILMNVWSAEEICCLLCFSFWNKRCVIKMNGPRLMGWLRKRKEMTRLKRNMLVNGPWKHETDSKTGLLRRNGAQQCMRCIDGA